MCFVTFPYGALGQVRYLIVSIPNLCLLPYIVLSSQNKLVGCPLGVLFRIRLFCLANSGDPNFKPHSAVSHSDLDMLCIPCTRAGMISRNIG